MHKGVVALAAAIGLAIAAAPPLRAQQEQPGSVTFKVRGAAERLEMTVNKSRVVEFPFEVPRLMVNNPDLVRVSPISSKSIQLSALKSGVTQLNVWDTDGNVTTLDLIILGDVAELDMTLKSLFPEAALRLYPLNSSLYISGFVPKPDMVASILSVARDYFPQVINDMKVGGVHKVLLHVKVMEISRTKLRTLGFDWAQISSGGGFISQGVSGILQAPGTVTGTQGATVRFGIIGSGGSFFGFVEALRENDLARLLAEPTLVTLDGRPANFNVGGQVPIPLQQALGVTTVTYRQFGTAIDFVPIILGNGMIRLEVRPDITEIDPTLRDTVTGVPGFRQRTADTAVEMKAGQTLAIAGLVFTREDTVNRGIPWLADLPWVGIPFRRVSNLRNDVELIIFVTPELCEAMDPNEVPPCGPGQLTTTPTDLELYGRGYLEVPKSNNSAAGGPGGNCGPGGCNPGMLPSGMPNINGQFEQLPPAQMGPSPAPMSGVRNDDNGPVRQASKPSIAATSVATPRGAAIGTGAIAQPVSTTRITGMPQPAAAPQSSINTHGLRSAQPALIGSQGYDELK
jgi:pilus assembly protein CpaC